MNRPTASPASRLRPLELMVLGHVALLVIGSAWAFGGAAGWARTLIACWGSLSLPLALAATWSRRSRGESVGQPLRWALPFAAFCALVLLSSFNPSFSARTFAGQTFLAHTGASHPALPSTAEAASTREHLRVFAAIYLSCFNLVLTIRRRQDLRTLLLLAVANATVLAIFGTLQKLTSGGLYFGSVPAPNARFFATFVYANHWAAYVVLLLAACMGLLFHYARRAGDGEPARLPLMAGGLCVGLMAITPVLAGSRAGTLLVIVLLGVFLGQILFNLRRLRRNGGESVAWPLAGLVVCVVGGFGGALFLGRGALQERWQDTRGQWRTGLLDERLKLYTDTWHLAVEQPWFGWGLGSFDKTMQLIRPRPIEPNRQYEQSYVDAHSDWLQSLAEVGFVGTGLLVLTVLGPLLGSDARRCVRALPAYLLGGGALIVLYAAVEFPFANPAVMTAFWLCFFAAIQYIRLSARAPMGP